jgi:O-antigen/teichoic acid export membrane protein
MSSRRFHSFVRDNATVLLSYVFVYGQSLLLMPLIIKGVGAATYGGYSLLVSLAGISFAVSSLGVGFRAHRFLPGAKTREQKAELFYPQYILSLLTILTVSAIFAVGSGFISEVVLDRRSLLSPWILPAYLIGYLHYSQAIKFYRYTSRIGRMTVASICHTYIPIISILGYQYMIGSPSINILMLALALSSVVVGVPLFINLIREVGLKLAFYTGGQLREDVTKGVPLLLGTMLDFILAVGDRFILALYLSVSDVGHYVAGYVLGTTILFVSKAIGTVLPQAMAKAVDEGRNADADLMAVYAMKLFLFLGAPFVIGSALLGRMALRVFANEEVAESASLIIPIVALSSVLYGLISIKTSFLYVQQRTTAMFRVQALAATINVVANILILWFIPHILVAAFTTLMGYATAYWYLSKALSSKAQGRYLDGATIAKMAASALVMIGTVVTIKSLWAASATLLTLLSYASLGMIAYFVTLLALRVLSERERAFLRTLTW